MADGLYLMSFLDITPPPLGEHEVDLTSQHVTFLNDFAVPNKNFNQWVKQIQNIALWHPQFTITETGTAWFGEDKNIPVTLVESSLPYAMKALHLELVKALPPVGGRLNKPQYAGENFEPHISHKQFTGSTFTIQFLSLIHHQGGFGVDVVNLANFRLADLRPIA